MQDYVSKKSLPNNGEMPMHHAEQTHEPIIDTDIFCAVQNEMENRAKQCDAKDEANIVHNLTGKWYVVYAEKTIDEKIQEKTFLGAASLVRSKINRPAWQNEYCSKYYTI